jgi:hypothetical protein
LAANLYRTEEIVKKGSYIKISTSSLLLFFLSITGPVFGWYDKTHMAISQAAGYENWYNSAAADVTKTKAGNKEATNHWFNNYSDSNVTEIMVFDQIKRYNDPEDKEGHLYGAIIASLRDYRKAKETSKYAEYHMAFCAHYIGDLSMPLHNVPYNFFNKEHHYENDGIVESNVLNNMGYIQRNIYEIKIRSEIDLAREIARIANISRQLALKIKQEDRDLTHEEAYRQISHSSSLLRAILTYAKRTK